MTYAVAVIIPTLNEADSIGAVIAEIGAVGMEAGAVVAEIGAVGMEAGAVVADVGAFGMEAGAVVAETGAAAAGGAAERVTGPAPRSRITRVIVADGGSTDATAERAAAAGALVLHAGRGYGRACLAGALAADEADILVFMDGDGADDPRAIETLVAPIAAGEKDFVIGSRVRGKAAPGSLGPHQRAAGRGLGLAMRLLYGVAYTDMCALRAIRRDLLLALGMTEMTYGWNLEMQVRAARSGLRVLEVPVNNRPRLGGESKVSGSLRGSVRAGARILGTFGRQIMTPPPARAMPLSHVMPAPRAAPPKETRS